jgi:polyhydroxybutyrate depolymerase
VKRDGAFFDQILVDIGEQYCIDYDQVYMIGHSLGAYFTHALSCSRGDVIRASGSVGGSTLQLSCT